MNVQKSSIVTLGIPNSRKCPNCKKINHYSLDERKALADCIMANSVGLWALSHCNYCGYVEQIYPIAINGIKCTKQECEKLFESEITEDYIILEFIVDKLIKIYENNKLEKYNDNILTICLEIQQIQLKMIIEEE